MKSLIFLHHLGDFCPSKLLSSCKSIGSVKKIWIMKTVAISLIFLGAFLSRMEARPVEERLELVEGDMLMTKEQKEAYTELQNGRVRRAVVKDTWLWPNGTVYYTFHADLTDEGKRLARKAMEHWSNRTCIRFVERTDQNGYSEFKFVSPGKCRSQVGFINQPAQLLYIGSEQNPCPLGSIIHEIGHTIGFDHEHNRFDRDQFVDVNETNMNPAARSNFNIVSRDFFVNDSRGFDYDYGSIMHYSRTQGNNNPGAVVLIPKPDDTVEIGQRRGLSEGDIAQARDMYKCDDENDSHFYYDHSKDDTGEEKGSGKKPEILE